MEPELKTTILRNGKQLLGHSSQQPTKTLPSNERSLSPPSHGNMGNYLESTTPNTERLLYPLDTQHANIDNVSQSSRAMHLLKDHFSPRRNTILYCGWIRYFSAHTMSPSDGDRTRATSVRCHVRHRLRTT